jgi:uncharacterized protein YyaL (SSP411 family)
VNPTGGRQRAVTAAVGLLCWLASTLAAAAAQPSGWRQPPGAPHYSADWVRAIDRALPRGGAARSRFANRLILEPSPYLQRHADDAVDWWPWGEEAFALARQLERPVFLSLGYLACGGCHAMESECFENETLARLLNERYVAILVDREEHPEIEAVYLETLRAVGLEAGWPMTLWLLPDGRAFFAGTYFPAEDSDAGPGLRSILERLATRFRDDRARLETSAAALAEAAQTAPAAQAGEAVRQIVANESGVTHSTPGPSATQRSIDQVVRELSLRFDSEHGGLVGAPKFPADVPVRLLLAHDALVGDTKAREMAVRTLEGLMRGGLRDPLSGGFHRYATDEAWRVPHFEKMLADNALLTLAFLDGFRATGRADFAAVARETLAFLLDELADPAGGFYSALDAVSADGVEGGYYIWTREEIRQVLGAETEHFFQLYRLTPEGIGMGAPGVLSRLPQSPAEADERLASGLLRLRSARERRERPAIDRQLVLASNGLAISALARAGGLFGDPRYVEAARLAATRFLAARGAAGLPRILRPDGPVATLADLAAFCGGLIDLFEATGESDWFTAARAIERELSGRFERVPPGGFFSTQQAAAPLRERRIDLDDNLGPSGNALHLDNLRRLAAFSGEAALQSGVTRTIEALAPLWRQAPARSPDFLRAARIAEQPPLELVFAVPAHPRQADPFLRRVHARLLPQAVSVVVPRERSAALARTVRLVEGKLPLRGRATAYLCRGFVCDRPTTDPEEFARQLAKVAP